MDVLLKRIKKMPVISHGRKPERSFIEKSSLNHIKEKRLLTFRTDLNVLVLDFCSAVRTFPFLNRHKCSYNHFNLPFSSSLT